MGEKAIKGKAITKVLSCLVVIVFLMSTFSVAVIATDSSNSTASNVTDKANSSVESIALSNNITCLTCRDDLIQININKTETVVNESGNSDLPYASNTSSPDIINESDEVPDPDLPVINDTDIDTATAKTVSAMSSCSYVWIKVTDKYCYGYKVYVDGVYQFTEGESGTPDGYCCFKVTPGYHTFKLTLNGKQVSKGWNCQCGHVYNWVSMNDMIPHWCERPDQCKNPPTVSFDKSKYYEGDTVHATISTIYGVYYKIMDCSGTVRDSGYASNGDTIYYTIPSGASECCYWKICFYWDEGTPPLGLAGYEGDITTASYECTKCYSFYVCPHETPCKVWVSVEDKYCKGYKVYVDGVYQFTEGESGTPDGYCRFHVTPGTHKFELRKDGCSVSKSWYCQCGTSYRWISMNDMYPHWCECNKPDFVVQDIWWSPSNPKEGDTVTFTVKTKNQGSGNAGGFYVCYYVDGSYYDRDYVSSLSAGSTTTTSFSWTADCGSHSIKAVADCYDAVTESNEGNNARTEYINIVCKPDLITQDIYWSPSNPKEGDTVTFSVKTKNQGSESAGGFYVGYYIDGSYYTRDYVSSLSAGSTTTTSFSWTADCGSHSIKAVADCYDAVAESNEGNNARTEYINIVCKPDLIIQDIFWSPSNPKQGDSILFTVAIKNQGEGRADKSWFRLKASIGRNFFEYSDECPALAPGETATIDLSKARMGLPTCGECNLWAVADQKEEIDESNENNNERTETMHVKCSPKKKPDLIVSDIWVESPENPKKGEEVWFLGEIKNIGNGDASEFYVYWYIDDEFIDRCYANALDAGEVSECGKVWTADKCGDIQVKAVIDGANAVDESNENNNVRIETINIDCVYLEKIWISGPDSIYVGETKEWKAFGLYSDGSQRELIHHVAWRCQGTLLDWVGFNTWKFKGLKEGEVTLEITYGEKSASKKITVTGKPEEKADLAIQSITWEPKNPKEGDRITFYVKVKNQGSGDAGAFDVSFSFVDGSYKDCNSVSVLSAGSTSIQTFTWTANKCGYIFISAKADVNNAIPESNEGNNEEKRILSVSCEKPDLTISAIKWSPSNPKEGDTITFDIDITNKGLGSAGNTYVIYYMDGSTIDYDFIPPLSAGSTSTQTFTWPANKCGDIKVTAIVDRDKIVTENDETNNERTETVNIICLYLEKIWITGPDEIKAGETLQWQAYGSYSDGSQKELTSRVSWTVDDSDILQNIGNGKFKGLKGGEATLKITYEGKSASKKVTVIEKTNQPPKASFKYEKDGLTVHFTSTSSDPDGNIETYSWFFGDEGTSNQKNPTYTYSSEGTYTVVLLVWDEKGAGDAHSEGITVTEPKVPIKVTVKNTKKPNKQDNYPLPGCGGSITVKAHTDIHGKSLEEGSASFYGGEKDLTITLNPTKKAKCITVWQTPKIKDGVQEYWGAMAITPEKKNEYKFVRHTPWITGITINGKSPYSELIDLNSPGVQTFYVPVTNPQIVNRKVKVEAFLDRDEKTPWDFNSNDLQELAPKESKKFSFFYNKEQTEGIWRFRIVVGMYSLDNKYVVTDQHDWYLIVSEKQIMRARSLQFFADYYIGILGQEPEDAFNERMAIAWSNYTTEIGEITSKALATAYDPTAGKLIGVILDKGGSPHEEGVKALWKFSREGLDAWSEKFILNQAKKCKIKSKLERLKRLAGEEVDCWKSEDRDIHKINKILIEEGKILSYVEGFTYRFGTIKGQDVVPSYLVRKEMDKISDDMGDEWDYAGQTYNDLNGFGKYNRKYSEYFTNTCRVGAGEKCADVGCCP